MPLLLCFFLTIFSVETFAGITTSQSYLDGFKSGFIYMYQGSYLQFTEKNNLFIAAAAAPSLYLSFEEDQRISHHAMTKKIHKYMSISSDLAPVLSFPLIPMVFYTYGIKKDSDQAMQFATESFATLYLALLESAALSVLPIHDRPRESGLSGWETRFRQKSSFPSGHVIPYATFAFKTFQFYGPLYALLPGALFVATSMQRIRDGKHYLSDVVGSFFITAFASEGVRKAGQYPGNHPVYKAIFEHDLRIGYLEFRGAIGPRISFDW